MLLLHWLLTPLYLWRVAKRGRRCLATGPLVCRGHGQIILGARVQIRSRWTRAIEISPELPEARVIVGDDVLVNQGVTIGARQRVEIGDRALIADDCKIYDTDFHEVEDGAGTKVAPVRIGAGAWLGANVVVLKGVTIGEDAVIGAGAVVVDDIPRGCWRRAPGAGDSADRPAGGRARPDLSVKLAAPGVIQCGGQTHASPSPVPANDGGAGLSLGGERQSGPLSPPGERVRVRGAGDCRF